MRIPVCKYFPCFNFFPVRNRQCSTIRYFMSFFFTSIFRSEEHTSELQSHSEISYAVFCLNNKKYLYKVLLPLALIVMMYFTVFWVNPERFGPQIGLSATSMLTLIAFLFFFNDTATTEIYTNLNTLSLHDALPISPVTFRNVVCRLLLVTGETARAHVCSSHIQKSRMPSSA